MATIAYDNTTPFGRQMQYAIQAIKLAQANLMRMKQRADSISGGGVTPSALEGVKNASGQYTAGGDFGVAAGQGAAFYTAIQSLDAALFTTPSTWTPVQATVDLDIG